MGKISWTDEQQRALEHRDKSLIISASAGSGKTSVMIEKVIRLLKEGVPLERILVLTFGVSSSMDMYLKLKKELEKACVDDDIQAEELVNLKKAHNEIYNAQVSTLHAFCSQLLRTYCHILGRDNSFSVSNEEDKQLRQAKAMECVLKRNIDSGSDEFFLCFDVLMRRRSSDTLKRVLIRLHNLIKTMPPSMCIEFCSKARTGGYDYKKAIDSQREIVREYLSDRIQELLDENTSPALEQNLLEMLEFVESEQFGRQAARLATIKSDEEHAVMVIKVRALKTLLNNKSKGIIESNSLTVDEGCKGIMAELIRLTEEFTIEYENEKTRDNVMDFSDLEQLSLKLMEDYAICEAVASRFDYLFVDEYQDINPCQEEILNSLAKKCNRFYVGDLKQSIYGFRLCEPRIFLEKLNTLKSSGDGFFFNKNFRSGKGIIQFINEVFSKLMTERFGGADYSKSSKMQPAELAYDGKVVLTIMDKGQNNYENEQEQPESFIDNTSEDALLESAATMESNDFVYSVMEHNLDGTDISQIEKEGAMIAKTIWDLKKNETVFDENIKERRQARFSDIVILTRAMSTYGSQLVRILKGYGIPIVTVLKQNLLDNIAVRHLIDFLKILQNPFQDLPLIGVMMSPLYGFSPDELALIRRAVPKTAFYYQAVYGILEGKGEIHDPVLLSRIKDMQSSLEYYRSLAKMLPISKVLIELIAKKDYHNLIMTKGYGADAYECVCRLLEIVSVSKYESLTEFLYYLDALDDNIEYSVEASLNDDAVRIMTMHQSKGLEFPIVLLAGLSREFSNTSLKETVMIDRDYALGMMTFNVQNRSLENNLARTAAAYSINYRERCEELRLLYVAMTRAKEILVLSMCADLNKQLSKPSMYMMLEWKTSFADWIRSTLESHNHDSTAAKPMFEKIIYNFSDLEVNTNIDDNNKIKVGVGSNLAQQMLKKRHQTVYKGQLNKKSKLTVTALNELEYEHEQFPSNASGYADSERAIDIGNAFHKALQFISFDANSIESVNAELLRLVNEGFLREEELKLLKPEKICRMLQNDIFRTKENKKFYREKGFLFYIDDSLVQGIIDLMIIENDKITILDYKTSKSQIQDIKKLYHKQMQVYASAASSLLRLPIAKRLIYSFHHERLIEIK